MYYDDTVSSDVIIVLGCQSYMDEKISPYIISRLSQGVKLYKNGLVKKIILSGGNDSDGSNEADTMKIIALSQSVPVTDILLENKSTNIYENLIFSSNVAIRNNLRTIIITTDILSFT